MFLFLNFFLQEIDLIDIRSVEKADRWAKTMNLTKNGSTPPAIRIQIGKKGIPVSEVGFDY